MATILIVEDEKPIRDLLGRFLEIHCPPSTKILMAENGQQGLQTYEESGADLILIDCVMPVMTGGATLFVEKRALLGQLSNIISQFLPT